MSDVFDTSPRTSDVHMNTSESLHTPGHTEIIFFLEKRIITERWMEPFVESKQNTGSELILFKYILEILSIGENCLLTSSQLFSQSSLKCSIFHILCLKKLLFVKFIVSQIT